MKKIGIGYFDRSPWVEYQIAERLRKAAVALGCATEDEINFGVDSLRNLIEVENEIIFDDVGMAESEYIVMYLKKDA